VTHILSSPATHISLLVCLCVGVFLCWFICVDVFCVHLRKTRWWVEVVVHREEK